MIKRKIFITLLILSGGMMQAFIIEPIPLCTVYTPDSILMHKEDFKPLYAGNRLRYATCTGVTWFHDTYLAVANLYGNKITTYKFDKETHQCIEMQTLRDECFLPIKYLEQVVVSPDGAVLVVAGSMKNICFYALDPESHYINPVSIHNILTSDLVHNIKFSPDGAFFAFACFDKHRALCVYRVVREQDQFKLQPTLTLKNQSENKLKGICFTKDNKFMILAYSYSVGKTQNDAKNLLVVHKFDELHGTLGEVVSSITGRFSTEDITLLDNDHVLILTDQANDLLIIYQFDPLSGQIGECTLVGGPEMQLSFPHGLGGSSDGKFLAVTNYGDDTLNIYAIC